MKIARIGWGIVAVCLLLAAAPNDPDDAQILAHLTPDQRENVIVANRDGSPHIVGLVEVASVQHAAPAPAAPAHGAPARRPVVAMAPLPVPRRSSAPLTVRVKNPQIATLRVASLSVKTPTPSVVVVQAHPVVAYNTLKVPNATAVGLQKNAPAINVKNVPPPVVAYTTVKVPTATTAPQKSVAPIAVKQPAAVALLQLNDRTTYVPTGDVEKPTNAPTPSAIVNQHDAAWMYEHRFDTPAPQAEQDLRIPGIPVRSQVSSPFDIRSGAFHGVRAVNGYSAVRAEVAIPCGVQHFVTGPGFNEVTRREGNVDLETGYVYIGGWGAGPHGVAVDAGLQKSSAQAARDEYAFYFKYASNKPITSARFPCGGPDVVLELYPVTDQLLVFSATGVVENGRRTTITIVQKTKPDDGWTPDGGSRNDGIILKRIVAIAQPSSWREASNALSATRFVSGTYFGINGPQDPTPRIIWKSCEIGRVNPPSIRPDYRRWTSTLTWFSSIPGIFLDWPPLGIFRKSTNVCDAVGILLHT